MRQVHINAITKEVPLIGGGTIKLIDLKTYCPDCLQAISFVRTADNKEIINVGDCLCSQFVLSQGTVAEKTKYKVFKDGKNVSSELHLRNGKANPFGWSQFQIYHGDKSIGFLESGTLDIDKSYMVEDQDTIGEICEHCGKPIKIGANNPVCDHLYYPEYCDICKQRRGGENMDDQNQEVSGAVGASEGAGQAVPANQTSAVAPTPEEIHAFRKDVDGIITEAQKLQNRIGRNSGGREVSLVVTKLQEGKMWAGKILEAFGSPFPAELADKAENVA